MSFPVSNTLDEYGDVTHDRDGADECHQLHSAGDLRTQDD